MTIMSGCAACFPSLHPIAFPVLLLFASHVSTNLTIRRTCVCVAWWVFAYVGVRKQDESEEEEAVMELDGAGGGSSDGDEDSDDSEEDDSDASDLPEVLIFLSRRI